MVKLIFNDGDQLIPEEIKEIKAEGFIIDELRDFTVASSTESFIGSSRKLRLNFVGFTINSNGDILTVFPKKYCHGSNILVDQKKIFEVIFKHIQKSPNLFFGSEFKNNLSSNYPFTAFFSIYNYYERFGLHFQDFTRLRPNGCGKVNWKETIRRSQKFIVSNNLLIFPIYYNEKIRLDTFITECMIFAIDYTIDKFSVFIDKEKTNRSFPEFDFLNHRKYVLDRLHSVKSLTFSETHISLVNNLISFFSVFDSSGRYYFKHYSFANIWEVLVMKYLRDHYLRFEDKKMVLSDTKLSTQKLFEKKVFHPNLACGAQSIQPDHYLEDGDNQIIIDAKYFEPNGMDYKQISYLVILKGIRENLSSPPKFKNTFSALIIPNETRSSKLHFEINPLFNDELINHFISEERVSMNKLIDFWLKND